MLLMSTTLQRRRKRVAALPHYLNQDLERVKENIEAIRDKNLKKLGTIYYPLPPLTVGEDAAEEEAALEGRTFPYSSLGLTFSVEMSFTLSTKS